MQDIRHVTYFVDYGPLAVCIDSHRINRVQCSTFVQAGLRCEAREMIQLKEQGWNDDLIPFGRPAKTKLVLGS